MKSRQQYQQMKPPRETPIPGSVCSLSLTITKRQPHGLVRYQRRLTEAEMLRTALLLLAFVASDVLCRQVINPSLAVKTKGQVLCDNLPVGGNISLVLKKARKSLVSSGT